MNKLFKLLDNTVRDNRKTFIFVMIMNTLTITMFILTIMILLLKVIK